MDSSVQKWITLNNKERLGEDVRRLVQYLQRERKRFFIAWKRTRRPEMETRYF